MSILASVMLAMSSCDQTDLSDADARIRAIVNPPSACPVCWSQEHHRALPGAYTTRICPQHEAEMRARSDALKSRAEVRK